MKEDKLSGMDDFFSSFLSHGEHKSLPDWDHGQI